MDYSEIEEMVKREIEKDRERYKDDPGYHDCVSKTWTIHGPELGDITNVVYQPGTNGGAIFITKG